MGWLTKAGKGSMKQIDELLSRQKQAMIYHATPWINMHINYLRFIISFMSIAKVELENDSLATSLYSDLH